MLKLLTASLHMYTIFIQIFQVDRHLKLSSVFWYHVCSRINFFASKYKEHIEHKRSSWQLVCGLLSAVQILPSLAENTETLIQQQGFSEVYHGTVTGVTSQLSISQQRSDAATTQCVLYKQKIKVSAIKSSILERKIM